MARSTGLLALLLLTGCAPGPDTVHVLGGSTMGTGYEIQIVGPVRDDEALANQIAAELAVIDQEMSTWRDDSVLSRFNAGPAGVWVDIPSRTAAVLSAAERLHELSGGALDITLRPLSLAWGFQGDSLPRIPPEAELLGLGKHTGMSLLERSADGTAIRKQVAGLEIDVSALAKGYAVDQLAALLRQAGYRNFMVEIGGEIYAGGERPGGGPWRVAVEAPGSDSDEPVVLSLQDQAVASSGDYRNYFEMDGQRYAHILDPRTGRPAAGAISAVTVIADDAMTADALATALMVMSRAEGLALAETAGVEALISLRDPG